MPKNNSPTPYSAPTKRWYLAGLLNATDMPAMPSKYIAAIFRSETARATRTVEPIFDQLQIGNALRTLIIPLDVRLARINVMTDELCDTALETIPISATFQGF